jgi:hypothetical protein
MPRYYFHFQNEGKVSDSMGETLATFDAAKVHARLVASEMGAHQTDEHNKNLWITVTDEQGKEVYRVSLDGKIGGGDRY